MKELFRGESKIDKHVLQNIPNHVLLSFYQLFSM